MPTANDIILGALKFVNVYAPGEPLDDSDAQDSLTTLNDLLDSLSTQEYAIYATNENVLQFVPQQYQYTVGNYDAGTFPGTTNLGINVITGADVPANMKIGGDLSGIGIPAGTTITSFNPATNTVIMSQNATVTSGLQQIGYTIPGDFKIPRPLRVMDSFTRISQLDYDIKVVDKEKYIQIGYKSVAAPWPVIMWYNPTYPLGTLNFYQNPSGPGELHLFTALILANLPDLTTQIVLPQGYSRWLKRALGRELAPEYGAIWTPQMERLFTEAQNYVKSLNAAPAPVSNYDGELFQGRGTDAGWILYGGFRS